MSKNKAAAVNSNTATIEATQAATPEAAATPALTVQQQIDAAVAAALAALPQASKPKARPRDKMYVAGMCVAKFGYTDAISDDMVNYVNDEYGIANNATSLACIKAARAAVAAYVAETTPVTTK